MKNSKLSDTESENQQINVQAEELAGGAASEDGAPVGDNMADAAPDSDDNSANVADPAAEAAEWRDKYLRLAAEFDNYRKRTLREKIDLAAAGGEEFAKAILPVLDDMDRAHDAFATATDMAAMLRGFELIFINMHNILRGRGLAEIPAMGQPMDADLFDAVAMVAGDEKDRGRVIDVVQKGYSMKDKVIRHAKVVVGE